MAKLGDREDISGRRFGYLVAVRFLHRKLFPSGQSHNIWEFLCDCGSICSATLGQVKSGSKKSCGCKSAEMIADARTIHGHRRRNATTDKTWLAWVNMRSRCVNKKSKRYPQYGGRGISICAEWLEFKNFLRDLGECPDGYSLERINVDGNYEPTNCKWIPLTDQYENKRNSIRIQFNGKAQSLARWAKELNFCYMTLYDRYKRGDRGDILFRPPV